MTRLTINSESESHKRPELRGMIHLRGYEKVQNFAEDIGTTPAVLARILNGWSNPGRGLQVRIAKGLGVSLADLRRLL